MRYLIVLIVIFFFSGCSLSENKISLSLENPKATYEHGFNELKFNLKNESSKDAEIILRSDGGDQIVVYQSLGKTDDGHECVSANLKSLFKEKIYKIKAGEAYPVSISVFIDYKKTANGCGNIHAILINNANISSSRYEIKVTKPIGNGEPPNLRK